MASSPLLFFKGLLLTVPTGLRSNGLEDSGAKSSKRCSQESTATPMATEPENEETSLLACRNSNAAMAHLSIEALPPSLPEGGNVLLRVDNQSEKPRAFFWYKGKRAFEEFKIAHYETASQSLKWGRKYSGRERVFTNGSLLLQKVTQEDTGIYTLESFDAYYQCEISHVCLQVFKILTQPYLQVKSMIVERRKSATFECMSPDTGVDITWIFNNKPLDFNKRMSLSPDKHRLSIAPLRLKDTGEYQCEVSKSFTSRKSNPISLFLVRV